MSIDVRGKSDNALKRICEALAAYESAHEGCEISLYRQNAVSVRIRIIDSAFDGKPQSERIDEVWPYLERLSPDDSGSISVLLLLTPDESTTSFGNMDFESPLESRL